MRVVTFWVRHHVLFRGRFHFFNNHEPMNCSSTVTVVEHMRSWESYGKPNNNSNYDNSNYKGKGKGKGNRRGKKRYVTSNAYNNGCNIKLPVVPGQAGGGSFQKEKNYIAQKEFACRMCARRPTSAMPKAFLCCERAFCRSTVVMFCALK